MKPRDLAFAAIGFIAGFASLGMYPMAQAKLKTGEVLRTCYRLDPVDLETNERRYDDLATECDRKLKEERKPLWLSWDLNTQPRAD